MLESRNLSNSVPKKHAKRVSAAPAHNRYLHTRGPVGLMSGRNWLGGPSTFAKLSRILRQTFAKIRLEVALNLTQKLQNSHKPVSAGWGLLLQRRILAATLRLRIPGQLWSAGILPALPVYTHGSSVQLPVSKPAPLHKTFANKKLTFATPFAELSRRSTPRPKGLPLHSSIQGPFGRLSYIYIIIIIVIIIRKIKKI